LKKEIEKRIFNYVYKKNKFKIIEHKDKPDFWINPNSNFSFGVEITELFENESIARLEKIDNYIGELLDSKKIRHKDDKKNIKVESIQIFSKKNELISKQKAIINSVPKLNDFINILTDCISKKNRKSINYNSSLGYFNLIINDHTTTLSAINNIDISQYLFTEKLNQILFESPFEEILLITKINNGKYLFPLKRMLFVYNIYLFQSVFLKLHKTEEDISEEYYYSFLIEFLNYNGLKDLRSKNNNQEIVYCMTKFSLTNDNTVNLTLYEGNDMSEYEKPKIEKRYITEEIEKIIEEEKNSFGFSCNLEEKIE
jgi:hypothetical protein|tara:strand:- start:208 stop:1146 length:939 start_codon:yes stop_codon:yes gene_type:complete